MLVNCEGEVEMSSWNSGWQRASSPGIYSSGGSWRIRIRAVDRKTGRLRERNRILEGVSFDEAQAVRESLRGELREQMREPERDKLEEFARYWLKVKRPLIDPGTYERYEAALEDHAFKRLGRVSLRDLRTMQVQEWINAELQDGYRLATVKGWFRVFRTMVQDAIDDLELRRDPSRRVRFPVAQEREERNALLPEQLARFLSEMKRRFPRHYPLAATLAMTGLRFCHASALKWEDFEQDARVLRIRRRQLRGRVGPVTLVKRAPKEYPIAPDLMVILSEYRRGVGARRRRPRRWMFPSREGGLRCPSSLHKPWLACLRAAGIDGRFTVHGLRRTFVDLARRARVDAVVTRSLTGHVTEKMRFHYSSVGTDEQRLAVAAVADLIRAGGDRGGDRPAKCTSAP
jgi:integrase